MNNPPVPVQQQISLSGADLLATSRQNLVWLFEDTRNLKKDGEDCFVSDGRMNESELWNSQHSALSTHRHAEAFL
jgi:hypothetical protein